MWFSQHMSIKIFYLSSEVGPDLQICSQRTIIIGYSWDKCIANYLLQIVPGLQSRTTNHRSCGAGPGNLHFQGASHVLLPYKVGNHCAHKGCTSSFSLAVHRHHLQSFVQNENACSPSQTYTDSESSELKLSECF